MGAAQGKEGRSYARRRLSPMVYVELGDANGGILLNLSEGGMALQSALSLGTEGQTDIRFQLPGASPIAAKAQIVWMSASQKEAGIQFLDLSEKSRNEIRTWVASEDLPKRAAPTQQPKAPPVQQPRTAPVQQPNAVPVQQHGEANAPEPSSPAPREPSNQRFPRQAAPRPASPPPRVSAPPPTTPAYAAPPVPPVQEASPPIPRNTVAAEHPRVAPLIDPLPQTPSHTWIDREIFGVDQQAGIRTKKPGSSSNVIIIGLLFAGLFFVLGATASRHGFLDRWMTYAQSWIPGNEFPRQDASKQPAGSQTAPTDNTADDSAAKSLEPSQSAKTLEPSSPASSASEQSQSTQPQESTAKNERGATPPTSQPSAQSPPPSATTPKPRTESGTKPMVDVGTGSVSSELDGTSGYTLLVTAPSPGGAPFIVNLPQEPISASSTVAISSRRSVRVPPAVDANSSRTTERVTVGKLLARSDPFYPAEARKERIEGNVEIRAMVGNGGEVTAVEVLSGPSILGDAAATAVREWRYQPTLIDGHPVTTRDDITMVFRLP